MDQDADTWQAIEHNGTSIEVFPFEQIFEPSDDQMRQSDRW